MFCYIMILLPDVSNLIISVLQPVAHHLRAIQGEVDGVFSQNLRHQAGGLQDEADFRGR